jgi:hypothetical protein
MAGETIALAALKSQCFTLLDPVCSKRFFGNAHRRDPSEDHYGQ